MTTALNPMRMAIGQLNMQWSSEKNLAGMLNAMALAAEQGASLCSFPELAVTGLHRQVPALAKPELISRCLEEIQASCVRHSMAVAFGAPTFGGDGAIFNSHLFFGETGTCEGLIEKEGLTDAEATFFARGSSRPVMILKGQRCSAVICREIDDFDRVCSQLPAGTTDLVFWPGSMRPDPEKPVQDPPEHVVKAQNLAQKLRSYVIQANWPNALNRPEEGEHTGHSAVIAPDGRLLFRLPKAESGLAVFNLGESEYEWHAEDTWAVA